MTQSRITICQHQVGDMRIYTTHHKSESIKLRHTAPPLQLVRGNLAKQPNISHLRIGNVLHVPISPPQHTSKGIFEIDMRYHYPSFNNISDLK